jgi:PIN domain nuclease of toxin-antitoxin system
VLNSEPGADGVADALGGDPIISAVNYAEVISKLVERGKPWRDAVAVINALALAVIDFDIGLAARAGALRAETKKRGLSLGDRACLALAEREKAPAITCEHIWPGAAQNIDVHYIDNRRKS